MVLRSKSVTIREVAREAGVTISTVSNALNGKPMREETRAAVLAAATRLNYRPSALARGLAAQRTFNVGFVVQSAAQAAFADVGLVSLLRGIGDVLVPAGYNLLLIFQRTGMQRGSLEDVYHSQMIDGVLCTRPRSDDDFLSKLVTADFPLVVMGGLSTGAEWCLVDMDNQRAAYAATQHLIMRGHRRIGFIAPLPFEYLLSTDRLQGYRQALCDAGIEYDEHLVAVGNNDQALGRRRAQELMAVQPPPTAILAADEFTAVGAAAGLQASGYRIPQDVALVAFDDSGLAAACNPPLSTVRTPLYEIGAEAAQLLLKRMRLVRRRRPDQVVIPAQLVIRQSSGGI